MLKHGGRLVEASKKYNILLDEWIDLSTGINPSHWPLPEIPTPCFTRLPDENDGLIEAAENYYKVKNVLPVAGSQAAIQLLPRIRKKSRVAVPEVGYAEHAYQWQLNGHDVVFYSENTIDQVITEVDVLILINPNNPTGQIYSRETILNWHSELTSRQGWVIVDEAFMDAEDESLSVLDLSALSGFIVLRSFGKFFGLAGIRSGFVFAKEEILELLNENLGQWAMSGVTRYITKKALLDTSWHSKTKHYLNKQSTQMNDLIIAHVQGFVAGGALFKTIMHPQAQELFEAFAKEGVLVRLLDNKKGLRFGLPDKNEWQRLDQIFQRVFSEIDHVNNEQCRKIA